MTVLTKPWAGGHSGNSVAPSIIAKRRLCALATISPSLSLSSATSINTSPTAAAIPSGGPITVSGNILVFARDSASAYSATSGLSGHGIPFELILVPSSGIALPVLNSTATNGNYGGIIVLGEVSYEGPAGFASALTAAQWQQMFDYQTAFGVRMVRLDVFPGPNFGSTTAIAGEGCCDAGVEQLVSISNATGFTTAGLVTGATLSTSGLWHYPAIITESSTTWEVAQFGPGGPFTSTTTAAVINQFGKRQQMAWFTSFATDWSTTSNFIQHSYIHWITRGLFTGRRRIFFGTQVDDMHLSTGLYSPAGAEFRIRPADLDAHVSWTANLNTRLPPGSSYYLEIGHNGNGDIMAAINTTEGSTNCNPDTAIYFEIAPRTELEYKKPLGTGTDLWPASPVAYSWTLTCASNDDVARWFTVPANRDAMAHVSHTFAHQLLNNATYGDANREIFFNKQWMSQVGIASGSKFSPKGLIPPAITGMHNGDAIKAFMDNGITSVVGDNTRPVLKNSENEFWPLITTVARNGYDGLLIIPRWATTIFFNCDLPACTTLEWVDTSGGKGDFNALLVDAKETNTRHLLGLHHDPFMFHQANLRQTDVEAFTVGNQSGKMSLIQIWVETIVQEMTRLTTWPIITITHDNIAREFSERMARDKCKPSIKYTLSADASSIASVDIGASGNRCSVPIPLTLPVDATTTASGTTSEKVGSDPVVKWSTLSGSTVTWKFNTPIAL
ncbi:hypothetical protein FKW77_005623 [Venturia effusa]|uniref:Extracellular serine-rich protein n=1 Tax=Venturia effusa TaxID=50376 RepID=A0A517LQ69_9PEZI|nr:hypothetical protein FKW77_005623 [Venturia effusa]